jgi:hypothetical protein
MGRAIDMENDISSLKVRIEKLENIVRGMTHTMSETKHIDLVEETKPKEADEKEETNNEGNGKSGVKSNKRNADNKKKSSKS